MRIKLTFRDGLHAHDTLYPIPQPSKDLTIAELCTRIQAQFHLTLPIHLELDGFRLFESGMVSDMVKDMDTIVVRKVSSGWSIVNAFKSLIGLTRAYEENEVDQRGQVSAKRRRIAEDKSSTSESETESSDDDVSSNASSSSSASQKTDRLISSSEETSSSETSSSEASVGASTSSESSSSSSESSDSDSASSTESDTEEKVNTVKEAPKQQVPPGQGKAATQKRNARRRYRRMMEAMGGPAEAMDEDNVAEDVLEEIPSTKPSKSNIIDGWQVRPNFADVKNKSKGFRKGMQTKPFQRQHIKFDQDAEEANGTGKSIGDDYAAPEPARAFITTVELEANQSNKKSKRRQKGSIMTMQNTSSYLIDQAPQILEVSAEGYSSSTLPGADDHTTPNRKAHVNTFDEWDEYSYSNEEPPSSASKSDFGTMLSQYEELHSTAHQNKYEHVAFDMLDAYKQLPQPNDVIAYKMLELSKNYMPVMSDYKVARVKGFDPVSNKVKLQVLSATVDDDEQDLDPETGLPKPRRFELGQDIQEEFMIEGQASGEDVEFDWDGLVDTKLVETAE